MSENTSVKARVTAAAVDGRLPILGSERLYAKYVPFMWTCAAFSAATWGFIIGGYLPYTGDTVASLFGYAAGNIIGILLVVLSAGVPSFRYGVEIVDVSKSAFGRRGIIFPLIGLLATLLGWTYVLMAMTSRGAGNVLQQARGSDAPPPEAFVIVIGLGVLALVWLITSRGPWLFERLNNYIAPMHIVLTIVMLGFLLWKFGGTDLFSITLPADQMFATDAKTGIAFSVEFGVANGLTFWPIVGGLTRLVKKPGSLIGPTMWGSAIIGSVLIAAAAAFAGAAYSTADPTIWMVQIGGPIIGSIVMILVLIANIAAMVVMMYLAGVSLQHIKFFARLRWDLIVGLALLPGVIFAFRTEWLLAEAINWLSYNGMMFAGIAGVFLVDYFILRRERLDVEAMFARRSGSPYWFWGGFNVVALAVCAGSIAFYLWLYNPITLAVKPFFSNFGAGLPTMVLAGVVYLVLMKLFVVRSGIGAYPESKSTQSTPRSAEQVKALDIGL
jgi:NCS1 family nucleobase:cation symporter-1